MILNGGDIMTKEIMEIVKLLHYNTIEADLHYKTNDALIIINYDRHYGARIVISSGCKGDYIYNFSCGQIELWGELK